MYFNVREKSFPDGTIQATRYERYRYKGKRRNLKKVGGPAMHGSGATIERKEYENMQRARAVVWDLARANTFEYWLTLTFWSQTNMKTGLFISMALSLVL